LTPDDLICCGLTWLGHSTVLLDMYGCRLLTDPAIARQIGPLRRIAAPVSPEAVRHIDAVLLSHLHTDHAHLRSLLRVGVRVPIVAPEAAAAWLRRRRFRNVIELRAGAVVDVRGVRVEAVAAQHEGSRFRRATGAEAVGFLVRSRSCSIYFAGDTDLFPEMASLAGRVDVALLPVSGWGPRLGPGHLDPERAARAAELIRPRLAIPIHWGTLVPAWVRRRDGDTDAPARQFVAAAARHAPAVDVRVLEPGEHIELAAHGEVVDAPTLARTPPGR
jgi:L-ascorbate metabolism protein UlaG (beta-lactamase superfamily)